MFSMSVLLYCHISVCCFMWLVNSYAYLVPCRAAWVDAEGNPHEPNKDLFHEMMGIVSVRTSQPATTE